MFSAVKSSLDISCVSVSEEKDRLLLFSPTLCAVRAQLLSLNHLSFMPVLMTYFYLPFFLLILFWFPCCSGSQLTRVDWTKYTYQMLQSGHHKLGPESYSFVTNPPSWHGNSSGNWRTQPSTCIAIEITRGRMEQAVVFRGNEHATKTLNSMKPNHQSGQKCSSITCRSL